MSPEKTFPSSNFGENREAKFRYTCGPVVNCKNMNYSLTQRCTAKMNISLGERFENTKAKRIHTGNFSSF